MSGYKSKKIDQLCRYKQEVSRYKKESEQCCSDMFFNKQIWRVQDVAKFLGCSIGHIYNLVSDEKIPKYKKGKYLYFFPNDILNWILEGDYR